MKRSTRIPARIKPGSPAFLSPRTSAFSAIRHGAFAQPPFRATPGGDVVVIRGDREHWIPFVKDRIVKVDLDAKRIAATSLAIAAHVAVLMLLMLPAQVAPPRAAVDTPMQVTATFKPPEVIPLPPPIQAITREPRRPDPVPVQTPVPIENL